MKKSTLKAIFAASAMPLILCSCTGDKGNSSLSEPSVQSEIVTGAHAKSEYNNGSYTGSGFSLYADPKIWSYSGSADSSCDLYIITDKDFASCGISVYISDDDHGGKTAREIVMTNNNETILSTGSLTTAAFSFYYYEWAVDDDIRARSYFADHGGNYLCVYAESSNFGYVDGKIAELLTSIKIE